MDEIAAYLNGLPEYLGRVFKRIDFICGGAIAILYFFFADKVGLENHTLLITVVIIMISLGESGYLVFREERVMRSERERQVRMDARIGSLSINSPDPGPNLTMFRFTVFWNIWVDRIVQTDKLQLNMIHVWRNKPRWKFWKRRQVKARGVYRTGHGDLYRLRLDPAMSLDGPLQESAEFTHTEPVTKDMSNIEWVFELVLICAMPYQRIAVPLPYDWSGRPAEPPAL